jgi:acylpyruvate hydrolase
VRLATRRLSGGGTTAVLQDESESDRWLRLPFPSVGEVLRELPDWRSSVAGLAAEPVGDDRSAAPLVVGPERIFCIGLNYRAHILEMGREPPAHPTIFTKTVQSLAGARDRLELPADATEVDWEAELAVVIGQPTRDATQEEATAAIAGYTVMNDVSVRDWQRRTTQWWQGKNFEASTPLGPALVTSDEAGPVEALSVRCEVNGQRMQEASCADLVFDPVALVVYLSRITTLLPGDIVATGTPGGVGAGRAEPSFLESGDEVVVEVPGVGACHNMVRKLPSVIDM